MSFVAGVKSTVAVPASWVTWTALLATEAITPLTHSLLFADAAGDDDAGEAGAELAGLAAVLGFASFDVLHAATDSAAVPASARMVNRVIRAVGRVADIKVPSIVGCSAQTGHGNGSQHQWGSRVYRLLPEYRRTASAGDSTNLSRTQLREGA